ncbi:MAG: zinc-uptake complex component a periplasmic, partial [Verrucomicrobiaceae bacterium]|nr:zinc-uptake complex component a periplasmic [Verrucomicrobiaceae bacterium]
MMMSLLHLRCVVLGLALGTLSPGIQAQVKVATLHPLLADLARQVGQEQVHVVELFQPGGDVHHFEPNPKDLLELKGAAVIFASGMHLENYLD